MISKTAAAASSAWPLPAARLHSHAPRLIQRGAVAVWRGIFFFTMRIRTSGSGIPPTGGCILAVCHVSHLDPVVVSALMPRRISWLARIEFYRHWFTAAVMRAAGAIAVNRTGYPRGALLEAEKRLHDGEVVGIFPEGEIMQKTESVLRGGKIRQGAIWLAARSGCPVVPVVIVGTNRLRAIGPWLPAKRGRLWLVVGESMTVPSGALTSKMRASFAAELEQRFVQLFKETRNAFDLPENIVP